MNNNRVLVTGANGYIGSHVVECLLKNGYQVVACDVCFDRLDQRAEQLQIDIFDEKQDVYAKAGQPDILIHLAWRNGFRHNEESHIQDIPLHLSFLRRMMDSGMRYMTVMGTMHEIGYWEGAITAETPSNPLSYYGIAKNALRQSVQFLAQQKNVYLHWIRGFYIYGDDERNHSVFSKILEASKASQDSFPFTSGKNLYDFLPVSELAKQIVAASIQTEYTGIINCCSGEPISLAEMAEKFIQSHHLNIKLNYGAFPDRSYDSPGVWGDPTLIKKIMDCSAIQ